MEMVEEREKAERYRVGVATAMLMAAHVGDKRDGSHWQPWDVFPDLKLAEAAPPNESQAILQKFLILAGKTKVH